MGNHNGLAHALTPAGALLSALGHEVSNFAAGFKGRLSHTYVVSPYGTEMFGLDFVDRKATFGIPSKFYGLFYETPWEYVGWIKGAAGLFFTTTMGVGDDERRIAIRLAVRSKRSMAIGVVPVLNCVRLDESGRIAQLSKASSFEIMLREIKDLEWEQQSLQ